MNDGCDSIFPHFRLFLTKQNLIYIFILIVEILECPICQLTVEAMEKILANPKIDHDVEHVLEKTCRGVPVQYRDKVRLI